MKRLSTLATCLALACLSGCGSPKLDTHDKQLTTSFSETPDTQRVYAAYGRTGKGTSTVSVAAHTKSLWIRLACAGAAGKLELSIVGQGGASIPCKAGKGAEHGIISMSYSKEVSTKLKITVVPQPGMTWSAAIDAGRP